VNGQANERRRSRRTRWAVGRTLSVGVGSLVLLVLVSGLTSLWLMRDMEQALRAAHERRHASTDQDSVAGASAEAERGLDEQEELAAGSGYARARLVLPTITILAGGIAMLIMVTVVSTTRRLSQTAAELRDGAAQVTSAALQVSSSAQALSRGASEQAASLEQTSASMEEMSTMTRRNAESSEQAAMLMSEVDRHVAHSNAALESMVASMAAIRDSSSRVSKIIKAIDEIAFQTNILALNAAVEAARAGEAGMGFAVVADEVRNLAQRSAQAARDTATLIEDSILRANEGSQKVETVSQSIEVITAGISRVKALVDDVSAASRQQAHGLDQVTQAVVQMEKVTQRTAATAEESAAASEELNAQADATMTVVDALERLVSSHAGDARGGNGAPPAYQPPVRGTVAAFKTARPQRGRSPEEQIPLGTGTFGSF
jgi:methyl-accepting chemotaxis protein/methyl-accepting chemotaxis protein-1 (serine sensor receptor)